MNRMRVIAAALALTGLCSVRGADAQSIDVVGARAAGMSGAFVGVADDASAAYWNPAGLASGAYFSLLLDGGTEQEAADFALRGRKQSSFFLGAVMPALGLTYYRLDHRIAAPYELLVPLGTDSLPEFSSESAPLKVDALVTHHAGVTLVQSLLENVAIGATLKLVRGVAASEPVGFLSAGSALDVDGLASRATNRFDLDAGIMAAVGSLKAGVTFRNVREPEFQVPSGRALRLERQARAGASYLVLPAWLVAADLDLLETTDAVGPRRDLALGVEGRLTRRLTARAGARFNTVTSQDYGIGTGRSTSVGGSFAVRGAVVIDGAGVFGDERMGRGWRIGARFVY